MLVKTYFSRNMNTNHKTHSYLHMHTERILGRWWPQYGLILLFPTLVFPFLSQIAVGTSQKVAVRGHETAGESWYKNIFALGQSQGRVNISIHSFPGPWEVEE